MAAPIRMAFAALQASGIPAVVLRGYLPIDDLARSTDIDLYVPSGHEGRVAQALISAGWYRRRDQTGRHPHVFFDNFDIPGRLSTTIDVVTDLAFGPRLLTLRNAAGILEDRETQDGVPVPHRWLALFVFGLHVVFDKGSRSPANLARGAALWARCSAQMGEAEHLERVFGAPARRWTEAAGPWLAGGAGDQDALTAAAATLPGLAPRIARAFFDRWRVQWALRRARPFRVAVVGMDGSGKSTMIGEATALPSGLPVGGAYLGYNQFTTRTFKWILATLERWKERHPGRSLRVRLLDQLRSLWWPVELYARMRRAEWWRSIVFYDRYPFPAYERDDRPTTLPGRVMNLYERLWTKLLPAPDFLLLCDGDPHVLWNRKREYSFEEYERAHARLKRLYADFPGPKALLRTDRSLAETCADLPTLLRSATNLRDRVREGAATQ